MSKYIMTHGEVDLRARKLAEAILHLQPEQDKILLCPVPRGGVPVAYAILPHLDGRGVVTGDASVADVFIDDVIDSGATMERTLDAFPGRAPFLALVDKTEAAEPLRTRWVVFPWETADGGIEDNVVRLLQYVGEDPTRGGLHETPARFIKALQEYTAGYKQKPEDVLKVFEDGGERYDEMVVVRDIPFYSLCEHHLAPFFGTATIAYIPSGKVVGLSKLARLLNIYARRLQVQERLTGQVADAIMEHLDALGVGVVISARHLCMEARGVRLQGHSTTTSAVRGVVAENSATRAEFMALAG